MNSRLTIAEIMALGAVRGVNPGHVISDLGEAEAGVMVGEGERSLIARGLLSRIDGARVVHEDLAPWLDVVLDPDAVVTLVSVSPEGAAVASLMRRDGAFVVARHVAEGVLDIWEDNAPGIVEAIVGGLRDSGPVMVTVASAELDGDHTMCIVKDQDGRYLELASPDDAAPTDLAVIADRLLAQLTDQPDAEANR